MIASYFHKPTSNFCIRINEGKILPVIHYDQEHKTLLRKAKNEHYLRALKGYAMHKELLALMCKEAGESTPLVIETPKGRRYTATLKEWREKGQEINFAGSQIGMPITLMKWGRATDQQTII